MDGNGNHRVLEEQIKFIRELLERLEVTLNGFVTRVVSNERAISALTQCDALQAQDMNALRGRQSELATAGRVEDLDKRLTTVEEAVKQLGKNPWVAGLGSGGTVLVLSQVVKWLVDFAKGGGFTP